MINYSKELPVSGEYDAIVVGGGPAGVAAAIASGRRGLRVLLIEATGCLGGTSTSGALPFWLGMMNGSIPYREMLEKGLAYEDLPRPRQVVGGIFADAVGRIKKEGGGIGPCSLAQTDKYPGLSRLGCHDEFTFDIETGKRVLEGMVLEAGADILYYSNFVDSYTRNGVIEGILISNKDGLSYYKAKTFLDCSGDADVVARSGLETYKGERETGEMCAASLVAHIENIDSGRLEAYLNDGGDPWFYEICRKAREEQPELDLPEHLIIFPMVQENVFMINGGTSFAGYDGTSAQSMTSLTIRGRLRARILVENLFRRYMPGAENCRLRLTAAYPGIRETRRIAAEYALTEDDLLEGKDFDDTIALGGRHFDLARKEGQPFHKRGLSVRSGVTQIPYRALIPKGSRNIIVAGRCLQADGQALGPARIISTCFATGEAAGTAAYLSLLGGTSYLGVNANELRDELRKNGAIVE